MNFRAILVAAVLTSAAAGAQAAATLSGNLTVDNAFNVYLSTSPTALGTLIASGTNWPSVQALSASLTGGNTYYLQVVGWNYDDAATPGTIQPAHLPGNPDMFIGSFSLAGTGFTFENGGTSLNTDTTDWQSAIVGSPSYTVTWSQPGGSPVSFGLNGTSPWGTLAGIAGGANFIWATAPANDTGESFFETKISPALPEPATWAMMLAGFGGLGAMLRRRRGTAVA
ncbi:MAG TPA: PEPxxWA-CTERM sorting domain-containing protein [Caulobacteraceae bacterium]